MTLIRLRYVTADTDRHGNVRYYFRRPSQTKIRLKGDPGSPEFMAQYQAALTGQLPKQGHPSAAGRRTPPGSFGAVCQAYFASHDFQRLDQSTKAWRRRHLEALAAEHGEKPIRLMEARHIRTMRNERQSKPAAANHMLKALRALFSWAQEEELADRNPAKDVSFIKYESEGHHAWTLQEVQQFEQRHPVGTQARLALALLIHTAGRREDAVRLGRAHIQGGRIRFRQAKNEHRQPVDVDIPAHPELLNVIAGTENKHMTFLVTEQGKAFTPAGFGNKFRQWCDEAGLPQCSAHGLRKAAAKRLAEAGCTPHEIMSVTGHKSIAEVERYTRDAERPRLADSAIRKLQAG